MNEGVFLPESNKNKVFRFLYNSDELQLKTINDWVALFASCGVEMSYYPQNTNSPDAEIACVLKRKLSDVQPVQKPKFKSIDEQIANLRKSSADIAKKMQGEEEPIPGPYKTRPYKR